MKNLIIISVIILGFGCEKVSLSDYSANLYGKWSWVSSCPGILNSGPGCWFPNAKYPAYTIGFDMEHNFSIIQNNTIISTDKFQVVKSLTDNGKDTVNIIKFDSGHLDMYSISHDTLHVTNSEGILTITSHYKKIE